jgi:hypothetical protein
VTTPSRCLHAGTLCETLPAHPGGSECLQWSDVGAGEAAVDEEGGGGDEGGVVAGQERDDTFPLPALAVTSHSYQVIGSAHNSPEYLVEALNIVARGEVKPMIDLFPKEKVNEGYNRLINGQLRFRGVVTY